MASTPVELATLRLQVNQALRDHIVSLTEHIDNMFEEASACLTLGKQDVLKECTDSTLDSLNNKHSTCDIVKNKQKPGRCESDMVRELTDSTFDSLINKHTNSAVVENTAKSRRSGLRLSLDAGMSEKEIQEYVDYNSTWHWKWYWKHLSVCMKEPPRTGFFAELVNSKAFDAATVFVISANILFTILEADWQMKHMTMTTTDTMLYIETTFNALYLMEIAFRLAVHRWYFFCNEDMAWNVFDLILVVFGSVDVTLSLTNTEPEIASPTFLRLMRISRVAKKLFRVIRLLQFFAELRLMAKCVIGSALALFWSFMLLFGFTVVFAILTVQQFTMFLSSHFEELDGQYVAEVQEHFGSVLSALLSLFKCISGGSEWGLYYVIVQKTGTFNSSLFLVYILLVWMSITNIIMSIFVDRAMRCAQPDMDQSLLDKRRSDLKHVQDLTNLFNSMDLNHSGTISADVFQRCMQDIRTATYFEMKGLDIKDAHTFFAILTSITKKDEVDLHDFLNGWVRMKGPATALDLYTMQYQAQKWEKDSQKQIAMCRQDILHLKNELTRQLPHKAVSEDHSYPVIPRAACSKEKVAIERPDGNDGCECSNDIAEEPMATPPFETPTGSHSAAIDERNIIMTERSI